MPRSSLASGGGSRLLQSPCRLCVGSPADRSHADEPRVWLSSHGEEGFRQLLVRGRSTPEAEACDNPGRVNGGQQAKAFVPSQAITPTDVSLPGHPSMPSTLAVPGRHSRAVQRFVGHFGVCRRVLRCKTKASMSSVQERTQRLNCERLGRVGKAERDRKSTRLNSSHGYISY